MGICGSIHGGSDAWSAGSARPKSCGCWGPCARLSVSQGWSQVCCNLSELGTLSLSVWVAHCSIIHQTARRRARRCVCVCVSVMGDWDGWKMKSGIWCMCLKIILQPLKAGVLLMSLHKLHPIVFFWPVIQRWFQPTWMCSPECCGLRSFALSQNTPLSDGPGRPDAHRLPCVSTQRHRGRDTTDESTLKLSRVILQEGRKSSLL